MNNQPPLHGGGGTVAGPGPGPVFDRDRDLEEQRRRAIEQDEMASRDREQMERQQQQQHQQQQGQPQPPRDPRDQRDPRDAYPPGGGGTPHHSNASSLPIHQPVASRIPGAISPGGLLANHGASGPHILGPPPSAPVAAFGGPLHAGDSNRPGQHGGPQNGANPQHQMFAPMPHAAVSAPNNPNSTNASGGPSTVFGGPLQQQQHQPPPPQQQHEPGRQMGQQQQQQQQIPFGGPMGAGHPIPAGPGGAAIGQGQQPILNDALSYLDQVKVQFADHPDVYNRFLDIMKDFKSQTIDTPGVINRVSELFAGHPNLIQGFNTFLPPGYRIECGAGNDPNSIRVTTPQGTTVQSISRARVPGQDANNLRPGDPGASMLGSRAGGLWQQIESPEATFSTPAQNGPTGPTSGFGPTHGPGQGPPFDSTSPMQQQQAQQQHQQQQAQQAPPVQGPQQQPQQAPGQQMTPSSQRGGPVQPQNHTVGSGQGPPRNTHTPTPVGPTAPGMAPGSAPGSGGERRAPVEFNHAINYVNKIKNRFHDKPEIYKQFLEILQTYQREQRPITDVHSQVTRLFSEAPDLLNDFKQFLPETIPQNKLPGGLLSVEDGPAALVANMTQTPQPSHLRDGQKMPPVGNFAPPPSASKEPNKKRPRADKQQAALSQPALATPTETPAARAAANQPVKRLKVSHNKPGNGDSSAVEPTLVPVMPEPLAPVPAPENMSDEMAFFDRTKKYINNKSAMTEFLRLINMFTQDIISAEVLVNRAASFIGSNPELMSFFRNLIMSGSPVPQDTVNNRPLPPNEKVSLSHCRGIGPSYRLLPKREHLKPCSGRDEMCNSVLNDEFASHPTWASEDSGFVAHRKNTFEEGLHRIEEERHDYDFNIEANQKCIALLEPIAKSMLNMSPEEINAFQMPTGMAGPNTSIYKRVFKKIYGERGIDVVNELFQAPFAVLPIVLARMKQKDEEWRFSQREWEKVWAQQTLAMHLKSLDHMGIHVKTADKRHLTAKSLLESIKTKHEEQRRARLTRGSKERFQYTWVFEDKETILTLLRLLVIWITQSGHYSIAEKDRLIEFFEYFIHQFFGISDDEIQKRIMDIPRDELDEDPEDQVPPELSNGKGRRNGKKSDLRRGVLDPGRNGSKARGQEESVGSNSKETTPDVASGNEEDMLDATDEHGTADSPNERWLPIVPRATVLQGDDPLLGSHGELKADEMFHRPWYNLFCNQTIFLFFRLLELIYSRLQRIKEDRESVAKEIRRSKAGKPAKHIGIPHTQSTYFESENSETFWPKTVQLIESFLNNETEETTFQEILRHYYLQTGWAVYNISDLFKHLCRYAMTCASNDSKDKTPELLAHFLHSLSSEETSYQNEIANRKFAEKCIKDGDMFTIHWVPEKKEASCRYLPRDDSTFFPDQMERRQKWQYYISSYMGIEPTEGVPRSRMRHVVLTRNLPSDVDSDDGTLPKPLAFSEGLVLRICLNSTTIVWEKGTSEYFIYPSKPRLSVATATDREDGNSTANETSGLPKLDTMEERLVKNNSWMRGLAHEDVERAKENWRKLMDEGTAMPEPPTPAPKTAATVDVVMKDS